jgi:hemolysin-activating ACP:hemolysin acyltransferase
VLSADFFHERLFMTATANGNARVAGVDSQSTHLGSAIAILSPEEVSRVAERAKRIAAAFGEIVSVLMRTPAYRHLFLADLEWLVLPAIATGQFALAEARQKDGLSMPVAVLLWATVSEEVDVRLTSNLGQPVRLKPSEWASGAQAWLVEAIGDRGAVKALLDQTLAGPLSGRSFKVASRGADGKTVLRVLRAPDANTRAAATSSG